MSESTRSGRALGPNRPDFLDDDEALDRRLDEITEVDPETGQEYFKGTRVETRKVKFYRNAGRSKEEFLADHPEVPRDWVDDLKLMDAQRFTGDYVVPGRPLAGVEDRPEVIEGKLTVIARKAIRIKQPGDTSYPLGMDEENRELFRRSWDENMAELARIEGKHSRGELGKRAVELYEEAVRELEKALPVIRRLGLEEPPANL